MRYKDEPWRNRVVGDGWSHNPFKRHAGMHDDPDIKATLIAEKYIQLFTDRMQRHGWLPLMGVEVNFWPYGVSGEAIVDYIMNTTLKSFERLRPPGTIGLTIGAHQNTMRDTPIWAKARRNSTDAYDTDFPCYRAMAELGEYTRFKSEEEERNRGPYTGPPLGPRGTPEDDLRAQAALEQMFNNKAEELTSQFEQYATILQAHGSAAHPSLVNFVYHTMWKMAEHDHGRALYMIEPEYFNACKQMCEHHHSYAYAPRAGLFTHAYLDGITREDGLRTIEEPEIVTPPRAPLHAVRHVNAIKQLLMEATYRFHDDPRRSIVAARMHEALGDFDISFVHPAGYYNLAEHLNLSIYPVAEGSEDYQALRRNNHAYGINLMGEGSPQANVEFILRKFLVADRLLTIGNRFPYDEAAISSDVELNARSSRPDRVRGRIELTNFGDATSNIALTVLPVMAVLAAFQQEVRNAHAADPRWHRDHAAYFMEALPLFGKRFTLREALPTTPQEGVALFKKGSVALSMMRQLAEENAGSAQELEASLAEIAEFERCVIERQRLLLKQPWGGKVNAERAASQHWKPLHADKVLEKAARNRETDARLKEEEAARNPGSGASR